MPFPFLNRCLPVFFPFSYSRIRDICLRCARRGANQDTSLVQGPGMPRVDPRSFRLSFFPSRVARGVEGVTSLHRHGKSVTSVVLCGQRVPINAPPFPCDSSSLQDFGLPGTLLPIITASTLHPRAPQSLPFILLLARSIFLTPRTRLHPTLWY